MNSFTLFLFSLILCIGILSCDRTRVYEKNIDLTKRIWHTHNRLEFDFFIHDSKKKYNLYYYIRNSLEFPYSRIFVEYVMQNEHEKIIEKKLNSTYLFDLKTGIPYGKSNLGDIYNHRVDIVKNYHFEYAGQYKIILEQFNRIDALKGILSVGIRVEYADEDEKSLPE